MSDIRIYVASLSDYNSGILHGKWIDANQSADAIHEEIRAMLKESKQDNAEEWAIHDYEGFSPISLSEYEDITTVAELAELIEEKGDLFAAVYAHSGNDVERAKELLEEGYHGEYDSVKDYAAQYMDDSGYFDGVPDILKNYFDFESFAHDMEIGGDVFTIEVGHSVHIFDGHM